MPIAPVAGEPRGIQEQHGTDLSGAHRSDQPIEARAVYAAACRAAEVIVDHFNAGKPVAPGSLDQVVLPTLALGVRLTRVCVDWRTYTTALRLSKVAGSTSALNVAGSTSALNVALLARKPGCQHQYVRQLLHGLHALRTG